MDLSPHRINRLRHADKEDLLALEVTLDIPDELRQRARPAPYE